MSRYETLAGCYDALTGDVGYPRRADFLEKIFRRSRVPVRTVLDLACGTGTMTCLLARRGYEMIGVDESGEMLAAAREKAEALEEGVTPPLFLQQEMTRLDLYGTVEAAVCCLDSLNYLTTPRQVQRTFGRLGLFVQPGGVLVFDINSADKLRGLDGQVFLDEGEDVYCVWRTAFSPRGGICTYYMDIFRRRADGAWDRSFEEHRQRAYETEELAVWLREAGFTAVRFHGDLRMGPPRPGEQRIYVSAVRGSH